jgi:hypothetical protein
LVKETQIATAVEGVAIPLRISEDPKATLLEADRACESVRGHRIQKEEEFTA